MEKTIESDFLEMNIRALVDQFKAELGDYTEPQRILAYANKYKELMDEYEKLPESDKDIGGF